MSEQLTTTEDVPFRERVRENPRPAILWALGAAALVAVEFGAVMSAIMSIPWNTLIGFLSFVPGVEAFAAIPAAIGDALANVPTLLSRSLIDNQGYRIPGQGWQETTLGLSPMVAWMLRLLLIYVYAGVWLAWLWKGYNVFRTHYRHVNWTPRDDMIDRFRSHSWGLFGFIVVFSFLVFALFAPAIGPTTADQNIRNPYGYEKQYFDEETQSVETVIIGDANLDSGSQGNPDNNVGPMTYDDYGRFHPFGTLDSGKDLFTFMAYGARVSLFIGLVTMGVAGILAVSFSLLTAYYKGLVDLLTVIGSDSIQSLPTLLLLILLSVVLSDTWLAGIYNGALMLALILSITYWPFLWRAIRGPAFQVADREWVDAAKSFGQKPRVTMQKHMAPYVLGYLLVYASMSLGGVIISVAGLSFLGLGITAPTPEWGRAIDAGQNYVTTASWHVSFIPGVMIVLVVTAFNALGDGIRDAIDPQSEGASEGGSEAAAAGGGGA